MATGYNILCIIPSKKKKHLVYNHFVQKKTMESYTSEAAVSIQVLVKEMKQKLFSPQLQNSSESPSAYDTAWLAMIPDSNNTKNPMFKSCVQWVLNNQKEGGFWGDEDYLIHTLSSTLACILALATWNVGPKNIQLGEQCSPLLNIFILFIRAVIRVWLLVSSSGSNSFN